MIAKEKINRKEAMKALWEQINTTESKEEVTHIQELYGKLSLEEDNSNE